MSDPGASTAGVLGTAPRPRGGEADEAPRMRVVVADQDQLARRALRGALQRAGIIVVAEAPTAQEAVELARYYRPDVVLLGSVAPDDDVIAATRQIVTPDPEQHVVVLTDAHDDAFAIRVLRAGAAGYLGKEVGLDALPRALHAASSGEAVISRALCMRLVEHLRRLPPDSRGLRPVRSVLTDREWQVLDLMCAGQKTDQMAEGLGLTTETVRSYVKAILRKLGVSSRQEAVAIAMRARSGADRGA